MLFHSNVHHHATVHCQIVSNMKSEVLQYALHNLILAPSALNLYGPLEEALQSQQ